VNDGVPGLGWKRWGQSARAVGWRGERPEFVLTSVVVWWLVTTFFRKQRASNFFRPAIAVAGLGLMVILAAAAVRAERSHRAAVERVLRDYAGMAGTEFVRRTAFDVGFNGYQVLAASLNRSMAEGPLELSSAIPKQIRDLVAHLVLLDHGTTRVIAGGAAPGWLESWIRTEAAALHEAPGAFLVRHRTEGGRAATLVLVPLDAEGQRLAAFDVELDALRPFLQHSLDRGPLLPSVVGDHHLTNAVMSVTFLDHAGVPRLESGAPRRSEWEVEVPFGDFYSSVLAGSAVRVSLDPAVAPRLLPGGLPQSQLPLLALLVAGGFFLVFLALRAERRERRFARLREDFVVGVSHELRTPLAQIRLFTETILLGRCRSESEERRFLEAAARESVRLSDLVDNILDFSRAERGLLDVHPVPRQLAPLVAQVTQAFQPLASTRRVHLDLQLDAEARAAVDEAGFRRLLLNLLDNAVKYGPERGEVTVRLHRAGENVELAVEDRGPGIPLHEREAIFAPFQRLERDRRSGTTGAGLGLALVREFVARHGGACRIEERTGGGARFVVSLPQVEGAG
jgi:signal transduction histidine kinase